MVGAQKPSLGRLVHYTPHPDDFAAHVNLANDGKLSAVITEAHDDHTVNLKVFINGPGVDLFRDHVSDDPTRLDFQGRWEWPVIL